MQVKKIKTKESSFKYNPMASELVLAVGLQFYYNYESQQWDLNQDPYGDPDLQPMNNVVVDETAGVLSFEAKYQGKAQQFAITAAYEPEKIMLAFFAEVKKMGKLAPVDDMDDMQLIFEKGKLEAIMIYKHTKALEIVDSLNIKGNEGKYSLIKQKPWRKFELNAVAVNDHQIVSRSGKEEFRFELNLQPVIFNTVKKLIEGSTPQ